MNPRCTTWMSGVVLVATLAGGPMACAATPAEPAPEFRMFYCIHAARSCVKPAAPVAADSAKALAIARRALSSKDDFFGFIDADDTTLQFYVDGNDSIWIDLPVPALKGSYGMHTTRLKALDLIARLSPPLARYRSELKLQFKKWD